MTYVLPRLRTVRMMSSPLSPDGAVCQRKILPLTATHVSLGAAPLFPLRSVCPVQPSITLRNVYRPCSCPDRLPARALNQILLNLER